MQLEGRGDFAKARTVYAALTSLPRRKEGASVVSAFLGVARCERYLLKTRRAVDAAKRALSVALAVAPQERPRVLFFLAGLCNALGLGSEAQAYITEAETSEGYIQLNQLPAWFRARANSESITKYSHRTQIYYNLAYEFAERRKDYDSMKRVLNDFGTEAPSVGLADKQVEFKRRAYELALERVNNWTVYLCAAELAKALFQTGDLVETHVMVAALVKNAAIRHMPNVDVRLTSVGLQVAIARQDSQLLNELLTRSFDKWLEITEEPQLLGPLVAAVHALRTYLGHKMEARKVLESGIRALDNADGAWAALVAAAEFASEATVARARRLLTAMPPTHLVAKAHLILFEALILKRHGSDEEASSKAQEAATAFGLLRWPMHVAKALEIQGHSKEALRIYKRCGATYHVDRLVKNGISRGRPRLSSIDITNRQRTVISLLLEGRTNQQIASDLHVSTSTIDHQLSEIYRRFSVRNRFQLMHEIHNGVVTI
jgi:DNA-binding CsgD family transcriptional regulator